MSLTFSEDVGNFIREVVCPRITRSTIHVTSTGNSGGVLHAGHTSSATEHKRRRRSANTKGLFEVFNLCCGEPVTLKNLVCMLHAANNLYSSKASDTQHSYDVCAEQNTHRLPAITSKSSCQSQSVLLSGHVCIAGSDTHATRRHDGNTRTDLHLVDTQPSETESASESSSSSTSSQDSRSSVATSSTVSNQREIAAPGMRDSEASCGDSNTAGTTRLPSDFDTGHPMISNTIQVYETQSGHASLEVVDAVANAGLPGVGVCQGDRIAARRDSSCEGVSFLPSVKRFVPLDVSKIKKQHGFSPTPLETAIRKTVKWFHARKVFNRSEELTELQSLPSPLRRAVLRDHYGNR
eukprot:GHVQ01013556.1.p1 GENE.GHVQ01013556.1~~GHVQ01013556.1.p1  ORF type:complete len:351 (-),score=45.75 GHVQ01013556.1:225-1277(-)